MLEMSIPDGGVVLGVRSCKKASNTNTTITNTMKKIMNFLARSVDLLSDEATNLLVLIGRNDLRQIVLYLL